MTDVGGIVPMSIEHRLRHSDNDYNCRNQLRKTRGKKKEQEGVVIKMIVIQSTALFRLREQHFLEDENIGEKDERERERVVLNSSGSFGEGEKTY